MVALVDPVRPTFDFKCELSKCRYYGIVPKERVANSQFRARMIMATAGNRELQKKIWKACSQDILFFVSVFCWTHNPKAIHEPSPCLPFIPYRFQERAILYILWCILNGRELAIPKSREMGASWMVLVVYLWLFMFRPLLAFKLVSRKEDLVDKTGDLDALMPKIDFMLDRFPRWMVPRYERTCLHMRNMENGSTIDGESTNSDASRGGRKTSIFFDEFAAVTNGHDILAASRDATQCRIFGSTHKGAATAFYDVITRSSCEVLPLHWTLHPEKVEGLYYDESGKPRSPWYDAECAKCAHPMEIAQEIDMDVLASDFVFFDPLMLEQIRREHGRPAILEGDLDYECDSFKPVGFIPRRGGPLRLWIHLDGDGRPAPSTYVAGADVAEGTSSISTDGASNSSIAIGDSASGRKVAEYTRPGIEPHKLAEVAIALCKWFRAEDKSPAYLIWEANGPGQSFGLTVAESGFSFFYCRRNETSVSRQPTNNPGFWSDNKTKPMVMRDYHKALKAGLFVNPSLESIEEARHYIYGQNGQIYHSRSAKSIDPTGARDNHGDRVIADAMLWWGIKERPHREEKKTSEPVYGTLAWRKEQADRENKEDELAAVLGSASSDQERYLRSEPYADA